VTRPTAPRYANDEPLTVEDLVQRWRSYDDRLAGEELRRSTHRGTPRIVIIGWCVVAGVATTIVTTLPSLLRTVGGT
jgi:hypothetical protein